MQREELRIRYLEESGRYRSLEKKEEKFLLGLSVARLMVFVVTAVLAWPVFRFSVMAGTLFVLAGIALFMYLLKLYSDHSEQKAFLGNLATINTAEADSLEGHHGSYGSGAEYTDPHHPFSHDVDLFGEGSLYQYLNRTVTHFGSDILAGWLKDPYPLAGAIEGRQEVVRELADRLQWRQEFMAAGMKKPLDREHISGLVSWLDEKTDGKNLIPLRLQTILLPAFSLVSLILAATGLVPFTVFTLILLLNLAIVAVWMKRTSRIHRTLTGMHNYLLSFNRLLTSFKNEKFSSGMLNYIRKNISGDGISAVEAVRRLSVLIQAFDTRLNLLAGFLLNGLLVWDLQCLRRLGKWKELYGRHFPEWLEMIGKVDAFVSLGNYSYNNYEFTYPVVSVTGTVLTANSAGHPLIDSRKRVCNDFSIERKGRICIVTGANMSGKSTFLRTIAVNWILGMCGAPVCAGAMVFTPVRLFTSMRTTDSLSENESYFYAELKRLKELKSEIEKGSPVLFILDEILKGTNSADKSLGSKMFIKTIIGLGGTGLIATHDISLGELEQEFPDNVFNMCFEVDIEGEVIRFDYLLRNGITGKMNAALLMKQMGILG